MSCMKRSRKNAKIITDYFVDMKFKVRYRGDRGVYCFFSPVKKITVLFHSIPMLRNVIFVSNDYYPYELSLLNIIYRY